MNKPKTYLGSNELHKRHSVMVEGGSIPRSRVMDQTMIDRYLMDGVLDIGQHQAGEYLLQQAIWSCMWPVGVRLDGAGGDSFGCRVPFGIESFGNSMRSIREVLGKRHEYLTRRVVVDNSDVRPNKSHIRMIQASLDHIADSRCGRSVDPIRHLKVSLGGRR